MNWPIVSCLFAFLFLSACGSSDTGQSSSPSHTKQINTDYVTYDQDMFSDSNANDKTYGYERKQRSAYYANRQDKPVPAVKRDDLATILTTLCVQIPGVRDAGTLVTDEEILLAYHPEGSRPDLIRRNIRENISHIAPDYYQIYITDDPSFIDVLENMSSYSAANRSDETEKEKVIQQMEHITAFD